MTAATQTIFPLIEAGDVEALTRLLDVAAGADLKATDGQGKNRTGARERARADSDHASAPALWRRVTLAKSGAIPAATREMMRAILLGTEDWLNKLRSDSASL